MRAFARSSASRLRVHIGCCTATRWTSSDGETSLARELHASLPRDADVLLSDACNGMPKEWRDTLVLLSSVKGPSPGAAERLVAQFPDLFETQFCVRRKEVATPTMGPADHRDHRRPATSVTWYHRKGGSTTVTFFPCCGQQAVGPDGGRYSSSRCTATIISRAEKHSGEIIESRSSRNQAVKCRQPAYWSCCYANVVEAVCDHPHYRIRAESACTGRAPRHSPVHTFPPADFSDLERLLDDA